MSSQLMFNGLENNAQMRDSCSDCIEIGYVQEQEKDQQKNEFFYIKVTHQSVGAQIKLATDPMVRQVEKMCSLLVERNDLHTIGSSEATGSRRDDALPSSSGNRSYKAMSHFFGKRKKRTVTEEVGFRSLESSETFVGKEMIFS